MKQVVFIGTYSQPILFGTGEILNGHGDGIYVYSFDGKALKSEGSAKTINASFLVLDNSQRHLYATNELKEHEGRIGGMVSAFAFDRESLALKYLNTRCVEGQDPCHVEVDAEDKHLYCANFMSGSLSVLPIEDEGRLGEMCCFIQHEGSSVDPKRQLGPHAHGVFFSPDRRFVFIPDLGMDTVVCYRPEGDRLIHVPENDIPSPKPGLGPRHMVFHPNGRFVFMNTEMGSTVHAYRYDAATGGTELLQSLSTIPEGADKTATSTAAIKVHPNGRLLYVSNRGHDSLATYRIDEATGMLTLLEIQSTGGRIPRDFDIAPSGEFMVVAHQSSDDAVLFAVDGDNGHMTELQRFEVPTPICVRFYAVD